MNAVATPCLVSDCPVQSTGKCKLGNDPVESCPNYAQNQKEDAPEELPDDLPEKSAPVSIASGDVMHMDDIVAMSKQRQIRAIALVGEHKAGKTTLLASIYEMYCKGPFGGLTFAGSRTLVGFAKRHYLALLNSQRSSPTVPRTSRNDPPAFFHLALARRPGDIVDLVISDRSGEAYSFARSATELIPTMSELTLAERVCFILDGARIASIEQRTSYTRQFKQMIHALYDNGALEHAPAVEVLCTKLDITTTQDDADDQIKYLTDYENQVKEEFARSGLAVACHRVCALPKRDLNVGSVGLEDAVRRWTAPLPLPSILPDGLRNAPRQIDRLLARTKLLEHS